MQCSECRFWDKSQLCRKYAPCVELIRVVGVAGNASDVMWAHTDPDDWCGEFQASKEWEKEKLKDGSLISACRMALATFGTLDANSGPREGIVYRREIMALRSAIDQYEASK